MKHCSLSTTSTLTVDPRIIEGGGTFEDAAPPVITGVTVPSSVGTTSAFVASATFADPFLLDTHTAEWRWGDETVTAGVVTPGTGGGSVTGSHIYGAVGTYSGSITVIDKAGNEDTEPFTVTVQYEWTGLLSPAGERVIKVGSSVPLTFALTGTSASLTNLEVLAYVATVTNGAAGVEQAATSTNGADAFEYEDDQYRFNWSTKGLEPGDYQLRIDLGDDITHTLLVTLK